MYRPSLPAGFFGLLSICETGVTLESRCEAGSPGLANILPTVPGVLHPEGAVAEDGVMAKGDAIIPPDPNGRRPGVDAPAPPSPILWSFRKQDTVFLSLFL